MNPIQKSVPTVGIIPCPNELALKRSVKAKIDFRKNEVSLVFNSSVFLSSCENTNFSHNIMTTSHNINDMIVKWLLLKQRKNWKTE
jgi:hypothetical protein